MANARLRCATARLAGFAIGLAACGATEATAPTPRTAPLPTDTATQPAFGGQPWGEFSSKRFGLRIPLPDGRGWRIDDHTGPWFSATHRASGSELLVRTWREEDVMSRTSCEARARQWRKLPERGDGDIVERHALALPADFDTVVEVGVVGAVLRKGGAPATAGKAAEASAPVRAFALAFGGWAHRCFAYVYTTTASGPGAEGAVGERLAAMTDGSLAKIGVVSALELAAPKGPSL